MFKKLNTKKKENIEQQENSNYAEIYRQLRTNLEYSSFNKNLQVITITSTNPDEGKTSVSSNLAMISSVKYDNVLIIDCDQRKPTQHKVFNVTNKIGLSDLILSLDRFDVNEDTYFQTYKDEKTQKELHILTAGTKVPNPQELLGSDKFVQMLDQLKQRFDFIIMDCPPISAVADAIPVARISDGTVFVISAKETDKHAAKTAIMQLQRVGIKILGTVLTKVEPGYSNYYNYYYYG